MDTCGDHFTTAKADRLKPVVSDLKQQEHTMTVKELIALLQEHPPEMRVIVEGYEYGVNDLKAIREAPIKLNVRGKETWWAGRHDECEPGEPVEEAALLIAR